MQAAQAPAQNAPGIPITPPMIPNIIGVFEIFDLSMF
jgi:hypothetical protein